jgi:sporulation protein YunB
MKGYQKQNRLWWRLLAVTVGVCVLFGTFLVRIHPLLVTLSESKAESVTLKIIHNTVNEFLGNHQLDYDDVIKIGYDETGGISYVSSDMVKLNRFKSQIAADIQTVFDSYDFGTIALPLGTILGGSVLVGRGPSLQFRVEMSCNVECTFQNLFDDAGINQTRHQILLEVKATTFAIARFCKTSSKVSTNFVIAETVIVGKVPQYYTNVENSKDVAEDIENYGYDYS